MIVNIDGEFVTKAAVPVTDGAFLFGDSLFETLLARQGRIRFLADHLDRIEFSAALLDFPFDRTRAESALIAVAQRLGAPSARLRMTLTRGDFDALALPPPARLRTVVTAAPFAEPTARERSDGVRCTLAPNRRVNPLSHLPQMKRGNYADCLYAAAYARSAGAREALFIDETGNLLEGATTNLFVVRDGVLFTPPSGDLVLPGIMRRQVLRAAGRLRLPVRERQIRLTKLSDADEVFLTNTLVGLLPVAAVDKRSCRRGELWMRLLEEIERTAAAEPQMP